jgi:predicted RNA binding protein YcfA (HicA-like mRNA interferase family)
MRQTPAEIREERSVEDSGCLLLRAWQTSEQGIPVANDGEYDLLRGIWIDFYFIFTLKMKVKEVITMIQADGWFFKRQKGSHKVFSHPVKRGIVVVPDHGANHDLAPGTENSILKQAGLRK